MTLGALLSTILCKVPLFQVLASLYQSNISAVDFLPYSKVPKSPNLHFSIAVRFKTSAGWKDTVALVDSGATHDFIDHGFVSMHSLPTYPMTRPIPLLMADGEESHGGPVSHETPLALTIGPHKETLTLGNTKLGGYPIILGIPWLKKHDPYIHWSRHQITFCSDFCLSECDVSTPCTLPAQPALSLPSPPQCLELCSRTMSQLPSKPLFSSLHSHKLLAPPQLPMSSPPLPVLPSYSIVSSSSLAPPQSLATPVRPPHTRRAAPLKPKNRFLSPKVALINPAALNRCVKLPGAQIYKLHMSEIVESDANLDPMSKIPAEYQDYADVFSEAEAHKLPDHRPYDLSIPLQEGTTPPFGPVYNLSPLELDVLRKYIDDNLQKGFIRHSQSPAGAPILFVKKADGSLRLCVDYRGINKITIKNRYPLPLIPELLDKVGKAKRFTALDMRDGYHLLRMAPGEEWKTAFRTRYGLFEYNVVPFGLCNAPAAFQHLMNDVLREYLDDFVVIYLDDVLIYSESASEHKRHVRMVLEKLRQAGLYAKPEKCLFSVEEVTFLGYLISPHGIRMDPKKVEAVTSWPTPLSQHDIQVFLGFANFYRKFINEYSRVVTPLTSLLKKGVTFRWSSEAQKAFRSLKEAFTTAPILRHFDRTRPAILEADASNEALGGTVSQYDDDGVLHPCAFHSRKFTPAEGNYEIYDKEMLAIVECMDIWRHYFEGADHKLKVLTDHKNLVWFTETKAYNRRQARWAEKLSRFDFVIQFRPGVEAGKPDALSRRPDYWPPKGGGDPVTRNEFTFLKPQQVEGFQANYMVCAAVAQTVNIDEDLSTAISTALPTDPDIGPYLDQLRDPGLPRDEKTQDYLQPFTLLNDTVLFKGLVYVPKSDELKLQILRTHHDSTPAGHLGQEKTLELVTRNFHWPGIRKMVNEYVNTCDTCARNKAPRHKPHGQLHPLPIPPGPWSSVSMDFIVELPRSGGCNAILVCVDRLTKMAHFCPTTTEADAEETARLYLKYVFKHHGLPDDIVTDRGTQFTSRFTASLLKLCDIHSNKSTAFHPQSDGQTERVNQVLEQYLRIFCDHQQDNWLDILPLAEFAYNNAKHTSTRMSPFFANYGLHPRCTLRITPASPGTEQNPSAEALAQKYREIHDQAKAQLERAQAKYKENYDVRHQQAPTFEPGDLVWLSRRHISTTRPSSKLDVKRLGPFKILETVGESKLAYRLELPTQMRVHPVFHVSLLEPHRKNRFPGRVQPPPPPVEIDDGMEWEVESVLDSRIRYGKIEYLVHWQGYGPHERTWEPLPNLQNSGEAIAAFHQRHPNRPAPKDLPSPPPPRRTR